MDNSSVSHLDRITVNPLQCGGRPCIRGMRIRVKDILDLLAAGVPDIRAALEFAAVQADDPILQST